MCFWCHSVERLRERGGELARIRADRGKLLRCPWLLDEPITVRRQFEEPLVWRYYGANTPKSELLHCQHTLTPKMSTLSRLVIGL